MAPRRRDRYADTIFTAYAAAPPLAPPRPDESAPPSSSSSSTPTRTNRHTGRSAATGFHGTVRDGVDLAHTARSLATAPVVIPATVTGVAGVVLVSLVGTGALLALPAPIIAGLIWAAYGLGKARGADEAHVLAALEAGPGAPTALEASRRDETAGGGQ